MLKNDKIIPTVTGNSISVSYKKKRDSLSAVVAQDTLPQQDRLDIKKDSVVNFIKTNLTADI